MVLCIIFLEISATADCVAVDGSFAFFDRIKLERDSTGVCGHELSAIALVVADLAAHQPGVLKVIFADSTQSVDKVRKLIDDKTLIEVIVA